MLNKGNDGKGNNSDRDDWETPNILFDILNKQYSFNFDCCATKQNTKCENFSTDFLKETYLDDNICWINPPFSKAKLMFEHFFKVVRHGVGIYRCDNLETNIWQEIIFKNADWVFIPKGRISYQYNILLRDGKGSRFPSAFIGVGVNPFETSKGIVLNKWGVINGQKNKRATY